MCPIHNSPTSSVDPNYYYNNLPTYTPDGSDTTNQNNSGSTLPNTDTNNGEGTTNTGPDAGVNPIIDSNIPPGQATQENEQDEEEETPTHTPIP